MKITLRPKCVYAVFTPSGMIVGCFYSEASATRYAGKNMHVLELPVETHGLKIGFIERLLNAIS